MARMTGKQMAILVQSVGLRGDAAAIAIAVAKGESGWDSNARGDTSLANEFWGPSIGLWQIRSENRQRGTGGTRDELANLNPVRNARAMLSVSSNGRNWRPWTVFTKGIYVQHMTEARRLVKEVDPDAKFVSNAGVGFGDGGGGRSFSEGKINSGVLDTFTSRGFWVRVGLGAAGVGLGAVGFLLLAAELGLKAGGVGKILQASPAGKIAERASSGST